jgi:hypothetical protein
VPTFFNSWLPFIYLYVIGGIFFFTGLRIITKSGSLDLKKKHHRFWLMILISGFFFFVIVHASLIVAALYL